MSTGNSEENNPKGQKELISIGSTHGMFHSQASAAREVHTSWKTWVPPPLVALPHALIIYITWQKEEKKQNWTNRFKNCWWMEDKKRCGRWLIGALQLHFSRVVGRNGPPDWYGTNTLGTLRSWHRVKGRDTIPWFQALFTSSA